MSAKGKPVPAAPSPKKPGAWDWTGPLVWACPRCGATQLVEELCPTCQHCQYYESVT